MEINTNLADSLEKTEYQSQYDEKATDILADKQVLSRIVKGTVKEFAEYSLEEIEASIEGEPQVSEVNVHPGMANKQKITGMPTESKIPNEGKVTYDIRFTIITPDKERLKIIINVEAQKKYHVGYGFAPRGIFYCARMISEQLDTEFGTDDYDQIKKVYSIWICMDAPQWAANTITAYEIKPRDVYGTFRGEEKYDLLSVNIIRLSAKGRATGKNELIKMLTVLFSQTLDAETKKKILKEEHGMRMTEKLEGRLKSMCNLSEGILERGILIGQMHILRSLCKHMSMPDMINILKYEEHFVKKVVALLKQYPDASDEELVELLKEE